MKEITWNTNFGSPQIHCQLVIEEIEITDPKDIEEANLLTEDNDHNGVCKIAMKYTDNEIFKKMVIRIGELSKADLTYEESAIYQAYMQFTNHFRIIF